MFTEAGTPVKEAGTLVKRPAPSQRGLSTEQNARQCTSSGKRVAFLVWRSRGRASRVHLPLRGVSCWNSSLDEWREDTRGHSGAQSSCPRVWVPTIHARRNTGRGWDASCRLFPHRRMSSASPKINQTTFNPVSRETAKEKGKRRRSPAHMMSDQMTWLFQNLLLLFPGDILCSVFLTPAEQGALSDMSTTM